MRGMRIGCHFGDVPIGRSNEQSVDGHGAADVAEAHIEGVFLAISPKGGLVEKVCPRSEERNPTEARTSHILPGVGLREVEDVLPVHLHLIGAVANGGNN